MLDSLNIGLVGCGLWGRNILRDLTGLGCVVHVVDLDEQNRRFAEAGGAETVHGDVDELPPVDGLVVATPAISHHLVIERLVELGVPIFTEKPFTTDIDSARRIAGFYGHLVFVMHVWRYHPGIEMLAQIARTGELGVVEQLRTVRTNWTSPRRDIDSIWTLAPHDLSIALEILGGVPEPRFAAAEHNRGRPCGMIAVMGDSPAMILEVSTRYHDKRREVRLHCADGIAILSGGESDHLLICRSRTDPPPLEPDLEKRFFDTTPPLVRELSAFIEYLRGGPPPRSSAVEAVSTVSAMVRLRAMSGVDA